MKQIHITTFLQVLTNTCMAHSANVAQTFTEVFDDAVGMHHVPLYQLRKAAVHIGLLDIRKRLGFTINENLLTDPKISEKLNEAIIFSKKNKKSEQRPSAIQESPILVENTQLRALHLIHELCSRFNFPISETHPRGTAARLVQENAELREENRKLKEQTTQTHELRSKLQELLK